jgi:phage RecT family recombinase
MEDNKPAPQAGSSAPAAQAKPPVSIERVFYSQLTQYESTIVKLIGDTGIKPEKFIEQVYTSIRKTPALLKCDRASLFGAILTSAELGLVPNSPFGFSYIIPYGEQASFQIGYQGIIQLMYRVPGVKNISAEVVYSKDDFDYEIFPVKKINKHKPYIPKDAKDSRGDIIATYAVVIMDGLENPLFEIIFKEDLDKIKKLSKAANSGSSPYNNGTDIMNWMLKKAPIKQIFKTMRKETAPTSTNAGLALDDLLDKGGILKLGDDGKVQISYPEGTNGTKAAKGVSRIYQGAASDVKAEPEIDPMAPNTDFENQGTSPTQPPTNDPGQGNLPL